MHVKAKTVALGGLFLALTIVFMALGSVIETSTLFLLAAASFFVGIVVREFGLAAGAAFYLAAVLLGFFVAPNKFYVLTFAAMGFYILGIEAVWRWLLRRDEIQKRYLIFWIGKYVVFNIVYIPNDNDSNAEYPKLSDLLGNTHIFAILYASDISSNLIIFILILFSFACLFNESTNFSYCLSNPV